MGGLILSAPSSGAGKTTITLGLLRALNIAGHPTRSAKSGPDYIDPQFHAAATNRACVNLDAWAMTPDRIRALAAGPQDLIIEGAMGLFDGAPPTGKGATADLAKLLNLPVVMIIDAKAMSHSIAALVRGFATHDADVHIAGVILNRVGSARHTAMLTAALAPLNIPVLGAIPRDAGLSRPSRHLGLVQAGEMPDLDSFIAHAAATTAQHIDLPKLRALMAPVRPSNLRAALPVHAPLTIAIARDAAFSFTYPHLLADWAAAGATILPFSPLANDPVPQADRIYLPGGYPELYAAHLSANQIFMESLRNAAHCTDIYGECGGYMALGEALIDADGRAHKMAGLLGLTTSFADRKLHLGYRTLHQIAPHPLITTSAQTTFAAHEFHYARTLSAQGTPLFAASDAEDTPLAPMGLTEGRVAGSFAHIIAPL